MNQSQTWTLGEDVGDDARFLQPAHLLQEPLLGSAGRDRRAVLRAELERRDEVNGRHSVHLHSVQPRHPLVAAVLADDHSIAPELEAIRLCAAGTKNEANAKFDVNVVDFLSHVHSLTHIASL